MGYYQDHTDTRVRGCVLQVLHLRRGRLSAALQLITLSHCGELDEWDHAGDVTFSPG